MKDEILEKITNSLPIKEIYEDGLQPTVKEVGGFFGAIAGFFNYVVAAPLHKLNASYKIKTEKFIENLQEKYNKIPEANRHEAAVNIVGPTLEALRYNLDESSIKEMFSNLLINSMDNRVRNECHPSFIDIVRQMNSTDAEIWVALNNAKNPYLIFPQLIIGTTTINGYSSVPTAFPDVYFDYISEFDPFIKSASIINLERLGLLRIERLHTLKYDYDRLNYDTYLINRRDEIRKENNRIDMNINFTKGYYMITDFGRTFYKVVATRI